MKKVKNNLAQLVKSERYITQFQKLSNIHERALTEHNDQLDYTWKNGYETGVQDANVTHDVETTQKPIPIQGTLVSTLNEGFLVRNWRDSKKWISNWCFGLIAFLAVTPIPPEVLAILPENVRYYLIAFTAFCGFLGRYINQTKPVPLPLIGVGDADV